MCKCVYCNSEDLSVSDIIPFALTGAKLKKKSVCHMHNAFTNENFEKIAISNLDFFRSSLGLTDRKGGEVKYRANVIIDGVTLPNVSVSGRKSIYEDTKRLFPTEENGKKVLVGNIEKLKMKKGVVAEEIKPLDMSDVVVSISFTIEELFASTEMLHTVAKIAYEWFCAVHGVNGYFPEYYQVIVDSILLKRPVEDVVEIVVDGNLDYALKDICHFGSHSLFEHVDEEGYLYVLYNFWGVIYYKIRIYNTGVPNTETSNLYDLFLHNLDGDKSKIVFGIMGQPKFVSMPASEAVKEYNSLYTEKLEQLLKTTILTIRKTKSLVDELQEAFCVYWQSPNDFAKLVDYEENDRIVTIRILLFLLEHKTEYLFDRSYNFNLKQLFGIDDELVFDIEENRAFAKYLFKLHEEGVLNSKIRDGISLFNKIYANEQLMQEGRA